MAQPIGGSAGGAKSASTQAAAATAGRRAAIRARGALGDAIAQAYGEAGVAGGRPDGFIPATGYGLVPGYQPVASRSHPG